MKKTPAAIWFTLALVGLLAAGCSKDSSPAPDDGTIAPSGVTDEQSARVYLANTYEFGNNDETTIDDHDIQPTDYGSFGKVDTSIIPLRWGRFVTSVTRTATDTVHPGDSIAVVHVHKTITGFLKIRGIRGIDTVLVQKDFVDSADRNIVFRRFSHGNGRFWWMNWLPIATTLVAGRTISPNNINITAIELDTPADTITITDPLNFYLRYPWRRIGGWGRKDLPDFTTPPRVVLKATVISTSPDTDIVALRFGMDGGLHRRRSRMQCISQTQLGPNSYQRVFQTTFAMHVFPGFFHIGVDALTRETLYDDQAPYSVSWWQIPYRVR